MPNIVIQIEKDGQILHTFTLKDSSISKETIEIAMFQATGLNYDQYEVFYIDSENDLIMTVAEEDYSIAQMTMEIDTIMFHIDVKVPAELIKIQPIKQEKMQIELKRQKDSDLSQEDVSQEQKVEQVYQSNISQKNQAQQKNSLQEEIGAQRENLNNQAVQIQEQQQIQIQGQVKNAINQVKAQNEAEKHNKQQTENQIQKSNSQDIQCDFQGLNENQQEEKEDTQRLAPQNQTPKQQQLKDEQKMIKCLKYLQQLQAEQALFDKFLHKLSNILKPQCFRAQQSITVLSQSPKKEEEICLICTEKITKTPYFINYRNELICQLCQKNYEGTQNLVKIRNQKCRADLLTSKFITLLYSQLSKQDLLYFLTQRDLKNKQKKIDQLLLLKLQGQNTK